MTDNYIPKRLLKGSKISLPTREGIIRDTLNGMLASDVARKWNVDKAVISRIRNSAGIPKFKKLGAYASAEHKIQKVASMLNDGKRKSEIASELGCTRNAVYELVRKYIKQSWEIIPPVKAYPPPKR